MSRIPRTICFYALLCPLVLAVIFSASTASGQQLTPNPSHIDFRTVQLGVTSQGVTLTNSGVASITISADSINGAGFSLAGLSLPTTVAPGKSISFTVTFAPTVPGAVSGSLTIISNTPPLTIPLSGTCITQGNLVPNPASIAFGNIQVPMIDKKVTLTNGGGTSVTISAAPISGSGFTLGGLALPQTISAGASTSFDVTFTPVSVGTFTGSLSITSDGANPNLNIPLSGTLTQGSLAPSHASISFGDTVFNSSSNQTESLSNDSKDSITISAVSVSGRGFDLSALSLPLTLKAGDSTSFAVTFNPASLGSASGVVTVASSKVTLSIPLSGTGVYNEGQVKLLPECSLAKVNKNCKLIIDREKPLAPPPIQMYSGQTIAVIVKTPKTFERYFLDYQSGQATLSPDVASSVVQGLLPGLAKATFHPAAAAPKDTCAVPEIANPSNLPSVGTVYAELPLFRACLVQLQTNAIAVYHQLEPFVAPDSLTPTESPRVADPADVMTPLSEFLVSEFALSSKITSISGNATLKNSLPDAAALTQLGDLQKLIDAVAADLLGYSQRIVDLKGFYNGAKECKDLASGMSGQCIRVVLGPDDETAYHNMVTRTITYALNTYNLVSYPQEASPDPTKKKLLASIAINFADSPSKPSALRWEASTGVFFSTLPIRSFSVAPVFSSGAITNNIIAQNVLHPTAVPFVAANYRITNDLGWTRWKSAIYLTGAVGINPNTLSADFASGVAISWRGLMFSPLWHYGHDVRLTQGLYAGELLGASFKGSLATQNYWTSSFALGISIRVPSLVGR